MLVIFSGIYSCASHRCVPSVSFVCLLKFHKTPSLLHKNTLHFTDLCTSISGNPLLVTSLCTPGVDDPGESMALGWSCCPQLSWQSCAEVVYEMTSSVIGSHYRDLIPCKNFLEQRGWAGTLIWTLWCSSACSTYLRERLGSYCATSLLGWQFYPWLINRAPAHQSTEFQKAAGSEGSGSVLLSC